MSAKNQDQSSAVSDAMYAARSTGTSASTTLAEGKNVEQRFIMCNVNVVAGDQIVEDKGVRDIISTEGEASAVHEDISNEKLLQICNENTMNVTAIDILDDFRHEKLQKPDFEVYPQMRQVDVDDYYKGRHDHNQLTQEVGFLQKDTIKAKDIGIEDVVASIWQKKKSGSSGTVGITAIVASAGLGKSTLTRRIARRALSASPKIVHVEDLSCDGRTMVHYIELKDVEVKGDIKPSKFLFGGLFENEFKEDQAFKWLDEHQSEAVLIFDGLDQARWDFDEKNPRKMRKYEKASCWTVMYNILSRNILPHVNVYIASREFKVSELPAMARPETIITLNGLTFEDAQRLFVFLLKENGEELWQKIETMSPRLLNLISVPVFLIITAVVMGRDPDKPPPTTVTELYNRIISALRSVENIRSREQILSIVNKLKALAFRGMREGRVVFKEKDLNDFGISAEEVQDLMTKVPGKNRLSQHLVQGNFRFFFCHQSFQEYLAAIFIAEMKINEFSRFDAEHLDEERWSVVRRFVAGVVYSKSQNDHYQVSAQTSKREVLGQSIRSQLEELGNMELYTVIYESDDDDLMKQLDRIDVLHTSLSRDQAHVVGTLVARSQGLHRLVLYDCNIDDEILTVIARCLKQPVHVKEVNLRGSPISARALRPFLGHPRIEALSGKLYWKEVLLHECNLEMEADDVIITIAEWKGRFNIEDSSLSFDRSCRKVKFLEELFGAKLVENF